MESIYKDWTTYNLTRPPVPISPITLESTIVPREDRVRNTMHDSLYGRDPSNPSMKPIVRCKRPSRKPKQRIIACSEKPEDRYIGDRDDACAIRDVASKLAVGLRVAVQASTSGVYNI